jgi:hypothetical protein
VSFADFEGDDDRLLVDCDPSKYQTFSVVFPEEERGDNEYSSVLSR